jgi:outer membrane PBP1 activator LpoA protein
MTNLREHYLNRKAEASAAKYLAQQKHNSKVSKADWLCIAIVAWVGFTVLYMINENLGGLL